MILKGSQRSGARQLALHLLKTEENEHVEVHELRGFLAQDLKAALHEAYAISWGTRCEQFLFSLSLNPPEKERVSVEVFEAAIDRIERKLGMEGQPRAIVFHEKEGRRHAHCVWSRINTETMTAINLPHYKLKLRDLSKQLYLEHGWRMPRGLVDSRERDPANFTRAEWQQARRTGQDLKALKEMFRECWAISDSRAAFAKALEERGYTLARGDRRGFVAVDFRGEVYTIARYTDAKAKDVRAKLGDPASLPSVAQAKVTIAARMTKAIRGYIEEAQAASRMQRAALRAKKEQLAHRHRDERERLEEAQQARWAQETTRRAQKMSRGLRGIWDRLSGKYARFRKQNEYETWQCFLRDRAQKEAIIVRQLDERQALQTEVAAARRSHNREMEQLHRDVGHYMSLNAQEPPSLREQFREAGLQPEKGQDRGFSRDNGPGLSL